MTSDLTIVGTLIAGGFTVIVALINKGAKEQRADHGVVQSKLDDLRDGHRRIETKIDTHINDHAKGAV